MSGETRHLIRGLERASKDHPVVATIAQEAAQKLLELQLVDDRLGYAMNNIRRLLEQAGKRSKCRTCGKEIWYVQLRSGMVGPYQADALNHGAGCQDDDLNKGVPPCGNSFDPAPGPGPSED